MPPSISIQLALLGLVACGGSSAAPGRNVLLISIDTLRADHLGLYGNPRPTSPRLDEFASGSVVFEYAEASAPWTLASLASVMTSEVVSTHNCWHYGSVLDDSFRTLPEYLLAAGYDTACVVSHLFTTSRHGLQQGFVHTDDSYAYPETDPSLNITSEVITDKGIRFLDQKRESPDGAPWFLWLHYFDPHREYMQHAGISEQFVSEGQRPQGTILSDVYDGEVRFTDLHVGRLLDRLREDGFEDDTIVILLADHGEEFLDHGGLGHGHSLHREIVRVPLVLRVPGIEPRRVPGMVRQVDVLPTVLDLLSLPIPAGIAGRSLVPALHGRELAGESGALSELDTGQLLADAWRTERYKLIRRFDRETDAAAIELYDVQADPLETTDIAADHPDLVRTLQAELERAKEHGRERARLFGISAGVALTPGLQQDLEALGYGGEGPETQGDEQGDAQQESGKGK